MTSKFIITSLVEGVRLIKLHNPKRKNAFNREMYNTLTTILNRDAADDNTVVTIITGQGEYYSSGFDIKDAMEGSGDNESANDTLHKMIQAFINYPKLLIALINGPAIGIGVTSAALCDIIYASDKAAFQTPFVNLGLCAEGCSSYNFPKILGRSKATEMLILGHKMTANEAYDFNFVAKVIPHEQLENFLQQLKQFGKLPVNSVKINKRLVLEANNLRGILCECAERERKQLEQCTESEDFIQAVTAFMSKKSKL